MSERSDRALPPATDETVPAVVAALWTDEFPAVRVTHAFGVGLAAVEGSGSAQLPPGVAAAIDMSRLGVKPGSMVSGTADGLPWISVRVDDLRQDDPDPGFLAGAAVGRQARDLNTGTLVWHLPRGVSEACLRGLIHGTLAATHPPDRYRTDRSDPLTLLVVDDPQGRAEVIADAAAIARARHHARNLQNAPANVLTPRTLADRAEHLAGTHRHLTATIAMGEEIEHLGMGAFAAVARGSVEPACLIELRYDPPHAHGPSLGWVGKGVTFDSGGINLKRGTGIGEMKFDMSGAAAVLEAVGAVAELGLPVRVVAVAGATENMPGDHATRPGDIVRALDGTTIEITNTDAEGRLVLADCLTYARSLGVQRLVDVATLTGSVVTMFGGRYGALLSNDDDWAELVTRAGRLSGDRVWRMPLHPWYAERISGRYADLVNSRVDDQAGTILAGEFLHRFVGDVPWAHVDALAWDLPYQTGTEGGAAYGVGLLVEVARAVALSGAG